MNRSAAEKPISTHDLIAHLSEENSLAFETNPLPLLLFTLEDGRVVDVNERFSEFLGFKRETTIGQPIEEIGVLSEETYAQVLGQIRESKLVRELSCQVNDVLGQRRPVRLSAEILSYDSKKYVFVVMLEDSNSEEQAQQLLHDLSRIFEYSADMMCIMDFNGNLTRVNAAMVDTMGVPEDVLKAVNVLELAKQDGYEELSVAVHKNLEGEPTQYVDRTVLVDGRVRWTSWSGHPDMEARCVYSIGRDITERQLFSIQSDLMNRISEIEPEVASFEDAFSRCLELICDRIEWPLGHVYRVSDTEPAKLFSSSVWYQGNEKSYDNLKKETERTVFEPGHGLPGQAYQTREPTWMSALKDAEFIRKKGLTGTGLQTGLACPVVVSGQTVAVLEFFTHETLVRDDDLLTVMANVCGQMARVMERKKDETELRFTRFSMDNQTDAIFWVSEEGRFFDANVPAYEKLGYTREELLQLSVPDIDYLYDKEDFARVWAELQTADSLTFESGLITKSGQKFPVEVTAKRMNYMGQDFLYATLRDISEQVKMRQALAESEEKFQKVVLNAPGMVYQFIMKADGTIGFLYVSEGSRQIYELEPEQILGDPYLIIDIIHDRETFDESVQVSAQTLEPWSWEGEVTLPSGEIKWLHGASRPTKQANGDIIWDGLLMDITERKMAEQALREQRSLNDEIVQRTPALIVGLDADGLTTFVNPAIETATGYAEVELVGRNWWELFYPGDEYAQVEKLFRDFASGDVKDYDMVLTIKDGSKRTISWNSLNRTDTQGNIVEVIGFGNDVTDRKRAEMERDAFFEESFDLLTVAGFDGYFKLINAAFEKTLGYTKNEILSRPFIEFVHPEDREKTMEAMKVLLEGGGSVLNFENRYLKNDGSYVWLVWNANSNDEDEIIYAVARDFTFYKDVEKEKQTFIATLSHDLKTPLRAEHQVLDLLKSENFGSMNKEQHRIIRELINSNRFMYGMVDNLLTSIQYQVYELRLQKELTDVKLLIRSVLTGDLKYLAEENQQIQLHLPDSLPKLALDPVAIKRVLYNLIHNAFQHSPPAGMITISAAVVDDQLRVEVRDEGEGIGIERQEELFEPYSTSAKKFKHVGTGLGLYLSRRIVEAHGGSIGVASASREGSAFFFLLPLADADA